MENIKLTQGKGGKLLIEVDTTVEGRLSASGKSKVVATTGGFADSGISGIRLGLNVIRKA